MIIKEIRKLSAGATKLAVYYKRQGDLRDVIIGVEVLAKDGSILEWIGDTEASRGIKCDATVKIGRRL